MQVCCGCATATEAFQAIEAGAQALKIFPSAAFGSDYVKALKAVLPETVPVFAVGASHRKTCMNILMLVVSEQD